MNIKIQMISLLPPTLFHLLDIYACKKLPDSGNQLLRTPFTRPKGACLRGLPLKVEGAMMALTVNVSSF